MALTLKKTLALLPSIYPKHSRIAYALIRWILTKYLSVHMVLKIAIYSQKQTMTTVALFATHFFNNLHSLIHILWQKVLSLCAQ